MQNDLDFVKTLEKAGMSRAQAEAHLEGFMKLTDDFARKSDFEISNKEMRVLFLEFESRFEKKLWEVQWKVAATTVGLLVSATGAAPFLFKWWNYIIGN